MWREKMSDYITYPQEQETKTVEPTDNQITERNMREYFERVVSTVMNLTTQAQKVEELSRRVEDMTSRIFNLEQENYSLKNDLNAQIETVNQVRAQHDAVQLELHNSREHTHALSETIVMRDKRVAELDQSRQEAEDHANQAQHELQVAENRISDQEALINDLRRQLEDVTVGRDEWARQAHNADEEAARVRANLERIQAILNPPRPVTDYVTPAQDTYSEPKSEVA
jgi:chromosome segregation ATPase